MRKIVGNNIWKIAEELRNETDSWAFKEYVLGFLFYKYISEEFCKFVKPKLKNQNKDYSEMLDEEITEYFKYFVLQDKGYLILPSQLFQNVKKNIEKQIWQEDLQEKLTKIFESIQQSAKGTGNEKNFEHLFSVIDLNNRENLGANPADRDKQIKKLFEGIERLSKELNGEAKHLDLFGAAYEFLIRMYSSEAGKSAGEFFTPSEVSELLSKLAINKRTKIDKVYDPACGSGSLLLKFREIFKDENKQSRSKQLTIYGQEISSSIHKLCIMNMFLRNINYSRFDIVLGNTLLTPADKHQNVEAIVSNPPFSKHWEREGVKNDPRFSPAGALAPKNASELAFVMHSLYYLKDPDGILAIILFPGALYREGDEQKIRKYLVENNYVDCVIALAPNLFFGVSIAVNILVIKKARVDNNVLFIDGSQEYLRERAKNRLGRENIEKIFETYYERKEIPLFSKLVTQEEIRKKEYNLTVSQYIDSQEGDELNIVEINKELASIRAKRNILESEIEQIIREIEVESKHW